MFDRSVDYYDKFYSFLDYPAAARNLTALIEQYHPQASTLLDVACGTGSYLELLAERFDVAGVDLLPAMVERARKRCPNAVIEVGDMRTFNLQEQFDVVTCLFCSIGYLTEQAEFEQAMRRMAAHVAPGGLLIVEPWIAPAQCWTHRINCEVHEERDLKIVRMHTHERRGNCSVYDIHYLVGTPDEVQHFVEREVLGLYTDTQYRAALEQAGLQVDYMDMELFPGHRYGVWIGRRAFTPGESS